MISNQSSTYWKVIFDASPLSTFIVDEDAGILDCNPAAEELLQLKTDLILNRRGGDVLHCIEAASTPEGCGHSENCSACGLLNQVKEAWNGNKTSRTKAVLQVSRNGKSREVQLLVTATSFIFEGSQKVLLILEDLSELQKLRQLLTTCSHCRKIRDEKDAWHGVEEYLHDHLQINLSHGICPDCMKAIFPD